LPAAFVPIAEETGLINRLGSRVLAEACAAAVRWQQIVVAVNVSPIQFRQTDFVTQVVAIAKDAGLPLERLELEITENTLVDTTGAIGNTLAALRDKGIRIALDDFGTGYSSLNYLRKLPVDRLKIDRSFIQSLDSDPNSILIIDAIVGLARAMDVRVTAEGVETREQQLALVRAGCHNLQGYLFSRPVPAARIDEILGIVDPTGYRRVVA
jgi:EAL domain-containing protein (putative c-di-GMP-specific phosphodiesterase class I)